MRRSSFLISIYITILIAFILINITDARRWASTELPNPQKDPTGQCGRRKKSAICDPDGYLSESDGDTIDGLINFIQEGSHGFKLMECPNGPRGAQIAVAVVDRMPFSMKDKRQRAFQYAKDLHDRWGVGDADCQTGVVLFLAVNDRAMGFSTGAGVKKIFTDGKVKKVEALMKAKLREEEYGNAIILAVTSVGNIVSGGSIPSDGSDFNIGGVLIGLIGAGAVATGISRNYRSNARYRRCKKLLSKIDNDREKASNKQYVATSCPICLEDFEDKPSDKTPTPENDSASTQEENQLLVTNSNDTEASAHESVSAPREVVTNILERDARSISRVAKEENTMTSSAGENAQRVNTLPCGHMFHNTCISSWISGSRVTNSQCPVCREPIVDETERTRVAQRTNSGSPSGWDVYDDEYNFRMRRMHYYYNDFITWEMINSWNRDRYSHTRHTTHNDFVAVDPQVVAEAARASGGGGSSFSFGGGSSAGGGGGGGDW